jgi:hypothetical protein
VLGTDCEHTIFETLQAICMYMPLMLERLYTFYQVHRMIMPPTTNPDRDPDGLKDCSRTSPSIGCYMYPGKKKTKQIQKNNN